MFISEYHKQIQKYTYHFINKDIFEFFDFLIINKFKLAIGFILSIITSVVLIYINTNKEPYLSTLQIQPYFTNLTYPPDIIKNISYYNQSFNRKDFLQNIIEDSKVLKLNSQIKIELVVDEFNQNATLKFFLPQKLNKDELNILFNSFSNSLKNENITIRKNLNYIVNNSNNYFTEEIEAQKKLITTSIQMKSIIDSLIKKYNVNLKKNDFNYSSYLSSSLDHSTLFTSIVSYLINLNPLVIKEIDKEIKAFSVLKTIFDQQFNSTFDLNVKLRNYILPSFNNKDNLIILLNEKRNQFQDNLKIIISTIILGFLFTLFICFCIDFFKTYKNHIKGD